MESGGSGKESEEKEGSSSFGSDQSRSKLSSINCRERFDCDMGISTIEFHLTN